MLMLTRGFARRFRLFKQAPWTPFRTTVISPLEMITVRITAVERPGVATNAATAANPAAVSQGGTRPHPIRERKQVGDDNDRDLPALIRESLGELKALTAERRQPATASDETPSLTSIIGS
jgi:hypothetical protein